MPIKPRKEWKKKKEWKKERVKKNRGENPLGMYSKYLVCFKNSLFFQLSEAPPGKISSYTGKSVSYGHLLKVAFVTNIKKALKAE